MHTNKHVHKPECSSLKSVLGNREMTSNIDDAKRRYHRTIPNFKVTNAGFITESPSIGK